MGPQDTYVVKMEHLVTRARVRGELAPSRVWSGFVPLRALSQPAEIFLLEAPSSDSNWSLNPASTLRPRTADAGNQWLIRGQSKVFHSRNSL